MRAVPRKLSGARRGLRRQRGYPFIIQLFRGSRAVPGFFASPRRSRGSTGHEDGVGGDLAFDDPGQQTDLNFQEAAVADPVFEQGVGDEGVHALLVGTEEAFASGRCKGYGGTGADEIALGDHAGVDGAEDSGVGDEGPEGLHQIECEGGAAVAHLVVEAEVGVKADGVTGQGQVFGQDAVGEGEESVDGVAGRSAIAAFKVEGEAIGGGFGAVAGLDHAGEFAEVDAGGIAFEAKERFEAFSTLGAVGHIFHGGDGGFFGLDVVALQHGPLVADFAGGEGTGEGKGEPLGVGEAELAAAEANVFGVEAGGDAVEPAAHGEVGNGDAGFAEGLDGLGGDLNVAEEVDLADFADANFLNDVVFFLHLQDFTGFAHAHALGVEVEGLEVVARGHELADERGWQGAEAFAGRGLAFGGIEEAELGGGGEVEGGEAVGFVGEADSVEGTADAFGGVEEGGGDGAVCGEVPGLRDGGFGFFDELGIDRDTDALAGFLVEDDGFVTLVAVFAEDDGLEGDLDAVGGPHFDGAVFGFAGGTVFVIDGCGGEAFGFDEVEFGDDAEAFGGESDGAGVNFLVGFSGLGEGGGSGIDAFVLGGAFEGVGGFAEDAVDPLVEAEAGAVDELVDHAGGEIVGEVVAAGDGLGPGGGEGGHGVGGNLPGVGVGGFVGGLDDEASGVKVGVGLAESGDDAVATAVGGAEVDEEDLVFVVIDELGEQGAAADEVRGGELAFEDGELEMVSEGAHGFEDLAKTLIVGYIVTDQIGLTHLLDILADFWEMCGGGVRRR